MKNVEIMESSPGGNDDDDDDNDNREDDDENDVEKVATTIVECSTDDHDRCSPGSCFISNNDEKECSCPSGYVNKSNRCVDIDECAYNSHRCSHSCHNTEGAYTCSCPQGLHLSEDDLTCDDFDECQNEHICGETLECLNTYGSYKCICSDGKELDDYGKCQQPDLCRENNGGCSQ